MGLAYKPAALADLDEIWNYTDQRFGRVQAEVYLREIAAACTAIEQGERSGTSIDVIRPGYRKLPVRSHVIFFCRTDKGVTEIIRILHQRMDVGLKLDPSAD